MVRMTLCALAALALCNTSPAVAQESEDLREVWTLVNEANRQVLDMQDAIEEIEGKLSAWETSMRRASNTGSVRPLLSRDASDGLSTLADQVARHPSVSIAEGTCRDDLRAVGQDDLLDSALARLPQLNDCAETIAPRVRIDLPYECASLFWRVGGDGGLTLTGHVQDPGDLAELQTRFGPALTEDVVARPFPVCSALEALELPLTSNKKPAIRMLSGKSRVPFNDSLAFEVVTPDFYAFVYLAYLQADGTVVNLLPRRSFIRKQHPPRTVLRFGDGQEGRQTYTATAPAGTEAIIGIASRSPIDVLEDLEQGASGQYPPRDAQGRVLDQTVFLDLLNSSLDEEYERGAGQREISAEVLHLTVVPG